MPRQAKGARLYKRGGYFYIRDGGYEKTTGTGSSEDAESALADYIRAKTGRRVDCSPDEITIGEVLAIYAKEHAVTVADPVRIAQAIQALDDFWSDMMVGSVKASTCRRYMKERGKAPGTMRRELNVLQAAINYCVREGVLRSGRSVTLPKSPQPRQRWLTRQEVAYMLRAARTLRIDGRHLQWFIVAGIYTGTRKAAILSLAISLHPTITTGRMDPSTGMLYRSGEGERQTNKRRNPARMPRQLWGHVRRKAAKGDRWFVQSYDGARLGDIRKGWANMISLAEELAAKNDDAIDLSSVTPHTLKHTAITWALQRGVQPWEAAGYFSTSVETISRVYGHHSPDFQAAAVAAMERRK